MEIFEFVKLRISAYSLEIETGRYNKIIISDRLCKCCDLHVVEDIEHYINICPLYNTIRFNFYNQIYYRTNNEINLFDSSKYSSFQICSFLIGLQLYELYNNDNFILQLICKYLLDIRQSRIKKLDFISNF